MQGCSSFLVLGLCVSSTSEGVNFLCEHRMLTNEFGLEIESRSCQERLGVNCETFAKLKLRLLRSRFHL